MTAGWIDADWTVAPGVLAGSSTRTGGVSVGGCASLNLGMHVGDDPASVAENRGRLVSRLELASEPRWLEQVHGTTVVEFGPDASEGVPRADASVSRQRGVPLAIMTADCLPVLLVDDDASVIGAAHGGWRGLAGGVIAATVDAMDTDPTQLAAWLGPAISQANFEVGSEVRDAFVELDEALGTCFAENDRGRYQSDLVAIARQQLADCGIDRVSGGSFCTFAEDTRFFSHRRDPASGRMASIIELRDT